MKKLVQKKFKGAGSSPGTLVHIGERKTENTRITIIDYDEKGVREHEVENIEDCFKYKKDPTTTWINIDGLHDTELIQKLGDHYKFHPLLLEDIVNTDQRPKMEDFDDYLFVVLKMIRSTEDKKDVITEQLSLVLGSNFVISFQEQPGDVFNSLRERIRNGKGRVRKLGTDYLAYALIDAIVDNYFLILEHIGERIEGMDEEVMGNPTPKTLNKIHRMKQELLLLRKSIWPLREVISGVQRSESSLISEGTNAYLRDVHDHTVQVIDTLETYRDILSGLLDVYLSSISNRMNETMKVLTVIATIFIPLTFVTGWYGMNFEFMPELAWWWAYPLLFIGVSILGVLMLFYFKKKKWV